VSVNETKWPVMHVHVQLGMCCWVLVAAVLLVETLRATSTVLCAYVPPVVKQSAGCGLCCDRRTVVMFSQYTCNTQSYTGRSTRQHTPLVYKHFICQQCIARRDSQVQGSRFTLTGPCGVGSLCPHCLGTVLYSVLNAAHDQLHSRSDHTNQCISIQRLTKCKWPMPLCPNTCTVLCPEYCTKTELACQTFYPCIAWSPIQPKYIPSHPHHAHPRPQHIQPSTKHKAHVNKHLLYA
jgi:hypothetical protein